METDLPHKRRGARKKAAVAALPVSAPSAVKQARRPQVSRRWGRRITTGEWFGVGVIATVILTVVGLVAWSLLSVRAHDFGEKLPAQYGRHIDPSQTGNWQTDPPNSGDHYPILAPWGFSDRQIPPGNWLHNLEHGGIAVLYNCPEGCPDDQEKIKRFRSSAPPDGTFHEVKIVATPYPVPGHRFALMAWGWRLFLDSWDANQARKFYNSHLNQGPELAP